MRALHRVKEKTAGGNVDGIIAAKQIQVG